MSLVGNLEDLSLGDIMQIISLSQKSGVLALAGDAGSGRIVFKDGLVHAACLKGQADDLRGLLATHGLVDASSFDVAAERARELDLAVEEMLARDGTLGSEQIDDLVKASIESAILEMFSWSSGDFSFDVRSELEADDPRLLVVTGINAQYLAMEGMRIRDELSRDAGARPTDTEVGATPAESPAAAHDLFGDEPLETDDLQDGDGIEVVALEVDDDISAENILVATVVSREEADVGPEPMDAVSVAGESKQVTVATEPAAPTTAAPRSPATGTESMSVVLIDPDVTVLEWVKATIQHEFARVHVFQQAEQGLSRIRQYLIRGELPVVLISTEIQIDSLSGIHGLSDFVARLKTQASRLVVIGLHEDRDGSSPSTQIAFDAVLLRPGRRQLRDQADDESATGGKASKLLSAELHRVIGGRSRAGASARGGDSGTKTASLRDLRDTTVRLQEASSRGEILPVVLDFASEIFERVAILIVRGDQVFAIAGRGIDSLEVKDPLDSAPPISLQTADTGWIRSVLESGQPIQASPSTVADRDLLARLGGVEPSTAYLGPIQTGGSTIALLYGDQATTGVGLPDTSGLEVVLQHAGLALDRAALERALCETDASES